MDLFKLVGKIAIENGDANKEIDTTTGKAEDASSKMMGAFKKVGGVVATAFAVDKIKDFGLGCINAASDAGAASSQFTQVFGNLEKQASKNLKGIADTAGVSENRMKGSYTKIAAFAKTTGADTASALGIADRAMVAVADSAAFYDRTLEDTTESLQSFLKGNYENDSALGLSCTETTRNTTANKLYGKSFKDLSEEQKQLALLQMVEDANKASGALGQAAREANTWTNVTGNLKQSWTDFQAELGKPILEKVNTFVGNLSSKVTELTKKITEGGNPVQKFVDKLKIFYTWTKNIGNYASNKFKPALDNLKKTFTSIKNAVQPLIDKLKNYVKSGEASEDITNGIKDAIDILSGVVEVATGLLNDVIQAFKDIYNWGKKNETAVQLIATAFGTLTAAIVAYNIAMAIKNAGGVLELAQLALIQVQLWGLTAAQAVATAATTAFGVAVNFVTSPITLVILAIGALIAIGILLYKNWDEITAKCSEVWEKIKVSVGNAVEALKNVITKVFNAIKNGVIKAWNYIKDKTSTVFNAIKNVVSKVWNGIKSVISTVVNGIKNTVSKVWNSIKTTVSNVMNGIKSVISSIWNGIKLTISNVINSVKSVISSGFNGVKNTVSKVLNGIKSKFSSIFDGVKNTVKNAIDKVKGFFDNLKLKFPKIKMPHFKITGEFSIKKKTVPKLGIEWYKKAMDNAMILNSPTIFGYDAASGNYLGGGEAGSEVVAGSQTLMNMIQSAVAEQNGEVTNILGLILKAICSLDDGLAMKFADALENMKLSVNDREFGRLVKGVI